jgi:hypothetical protein
MRAHGPYGIARQVRQLSLVIDDLAGFRASMDGVAARS